MSVNRTRESTNSEALIGTRTKYPVISSLMRFCTGSPLGAFGAAVILFTIIVAVVAPLLTPYGPKDIEVAEKFSPPLGEQLLGTDELGRDVLTRLIYGARISLSVGILSVGIGISAGTLIGIFSAYTGGKIDLAIQRVVDALMAFPAIIMALALMAALGASQTHGS